MFEYLHINITIIDIEQYRIKEYNGFHQSWYEFFLNDYGKNGWELCAVDDIYYIFKRKIT